jgi:malate synthase
VEEALVREMIGEEMAKLKQVLGADRYSGGHFEDAIELFLEVATPPQFIDFLTLPAYPRVVTLTG